MTSLAALPLLAHTNPRAPFAWRRGVAVDVAAFLADVQRVARMWPAGRHVLNACTDRYHFAVGLAAAITTGRISLLPPTHTPEMVRQLRAFAPDTVCLADGPTSLDLPLLPYPEATAGPSPVAGEPACPTVPADQVVACVFTSGSTGVPQPHRKTWGHLVRNVRAEAERLFLDDGRPHCIVGTVPPQHMYGFESTVLVAWQAGVAFSAAHPFYPADIAAALAAVPAPRSLVTTPVHLRAMLAADTVVPPLAQVVSATAALPTPLALQAEAAWGAPLREIYGSTETGQVASRRTAQEDAWTLFPGVRFESRGDGRTWASGGHVEQPVAMGDLIEPLDATRFVLNGRTADLVNIAGKRSSLAYLTHQLLAIAGVADGCFYMPDDAAADGTVRLQAFAVAPGLTADALRAALRERIDAVFLPRPLRLVDALPRNSTGKIPRETLAALARQA